MNLKDLLIYDLIFSDNTEYVINIGNYIPNVYKYDIFIDELKGILKKSKIQIVSNSIDVDSKTVIWKLKVKK